MCITSKEEEVFIKFTPTPTNTPMPIPPTATVVTLPTAQSIDQETEESSAACNKPVGPVSFFTGMSNIMTMIAPLLLVIGYKRVRKFWD